jgi:hypothetical protein
MKNVNSIANDYSLQKRELVKLLALKIIRKKHISNALKLSYKLLGISAIFVSGMVFCHSIF